MADETLTLTEADEEWMLDKIGARFAGIEPGATLRVRMPIDLGLTFLDDELAAAPTAEGEEVEVAADFSTFVQRHKHMCAGFGLELLKEREASLAVLFMEKLPASSLN